MTADLVGGPHHDHRDAVGRKFLALGTGEVIGRLVAFAAVVYVSRTVGPEAWGVVAVAAAVTLYLSKVVDFGIETVGPNEVVAAPGDVGPLVSSLITARLLIASLVVVAASGPVWVLLRGPDRAAFLVYFLTLVPIAASTRWVYLGLHNAQPVALWRVIGESVGLVIVFFAVQQAADAWKFPAAILVGDGLAVTALGALLVKRGYRFHRRGDWALARRVMLRARPVMMHLVLGLALYNSDLLFLRALRSSADVGIYAAAYTLISFAGNLGVAYGMSVMPSLAKLPRGGPEQLALYHTALLHSAAIAIPTFVGGAFVARDVMLLVFGGQYAEGGALLQILLLSIPFFTPRLIVFFALVAHAGEQSLVRAIVYALLANLALNLVLISAFGSIGAAWATVTTEVIFLTLLARYGRTDGLRFPPLSRFWKPTVACSVMAVALIAAREQHALARVAVGAAVYALVLLMLGAVVFRNGRPRMDV